MTTSRAVATLLTVVGLLAAGCGGGGSTPGPKDCAGVENGTAKVDTCGVCQTDPAGACVPPDTIASWDGAKYIASFGVKDTATYGQLIKVWDGASPMTGFSFEIGNCGADVAFRASVFAWDGTKASGSSLYTSPRFTLANQSAFQRVYFDTGSLSLPAGEYVVLVSTSADQAGAASAACRFGATSDSAYPDGHFVYMNNGTDSAAWTSTTWNNLESDLAFQVTGLSASAADCAGTAGGRAVLDNCAVCDTDPANDCVQDCAGTVGGTAALDACGTCDSEPSNDCVLPDTLAGWDGANDVGEFGVINTATYGQTIKVWDGASPMTGFAFEMGKCDAAVTFRGSVYAWDGTKATGSSLFTSPARTLAAGATFTLVSFDTGSLKLAAGNYVIFASTSADQSGAPSSECQLGTLAIDSAYPDGQFVYQNSGANPSYWTAYDWEHDLHRDLAFKVTGLVP